MFLNIFLFKLNQLKVLNKPFSKLYFGVQLKFFLNLIFEECNLITSLLEGRNLLFSVFKWLLNSDILDKIWKEKNALWKVWK